MKKVIQNILQWFGSKILQKYKPEIIAITGNVGKTTTREAIYAVLKDEYKVRQSKKNYNTEYGMPVTIIGAEKVPGKSLFEWLGVFAKASWLLIKKQSYPQILILEMALDKPGDIEYLTNIAKPNIGVVTAIGSEHPVHIEFFKNLDELVEEKMRVATKVDAKGFAIINRDDEYLWKYASKVKAHIIRFGFSNSAEIKASDVRISYNFSDSDELRGVSFKVTHQGAMVPVFLPGALGKHQIYAALAAIAVGKAYDMNLVELAEKLKHVAMPKGRMTLIHGIKGTSIIDDTYNSSPAACKAAVETLGAIQTPCKKYAVLGDMAELGRETDSAHEMIGKEILRQKIDYLITVGEKARVIANTAAQGGMDEDHVFEFNMAENAGRFLQERIKTGDIILVKGSQCMRTEKVVKEIMAEPMKAAELLVRQGPEWVERE